MSSFREKKFVSSVISVLSVCSVPYLHIFTYRYHYPTVLYLLTSKYLVKVTYTNYTHTLAAENYL